MKKYLGFFRIRFTAGLQYRAAAYAGVATQFAWGFLTIFLYKAFYEANPAASPIDLQALSSYVWMRQAFLALFFIWFFENDIFASVTSGNIAYELSRPTSIYWMWFSRSAAYRMSRAFLRCLPILAVAVFLPYPYALGFHTDAAGFILFLLFLTIIGFGYWEVLQYDLYLLLMHLLCLSMYS